MRQSNKKQLPWSQFINGLLEAKDGAAAALPPRRASRLPTAAARVPQLHPPAKPMWPKWPQGRNGRDTLP